MKKRLCILVLLVLCAAALPILASAESSGQDGENITWTLSDAGVLTFTGSGTM